VVPGHINFVCDLSGGYMKELGKSYVNDRFYIYSSTGYHHLGHTEASNKSIKDKPQKGNKKKD